MLGRSRSVGLSLLACCVAGLACSAGVALAEEPTSSAGFSSSLEGPLTVAGGESLLGGEQRLLAEEARRANPEALAAREASSSAYEGLDARQAREEDDRAFGRLIGEPDGGPPKLPAGERIVGFPSDFAASLSLPEGKAGVIDSLAPLAVQDPSSGQRVSIDLTPRQAGSGFEAAMPAAGMHVRVGGRLSEGASLSDLGITLTSVSEGGTPLEGSGVIDGASVFYGDSEDAQAGVRDTDSLIKLGTDGFSEETILRSQRSPQKLYFKVGLPEGASLVQDSGSGAVRVVDAGQTIAQISAPSGHDADGSVIPLSLAVSGSVLTLTVEHHAGQYRLPIVVDPTVEDKELWLAHGSEPGNWAFYTDNPQGFSYSQWCAPLCRGNGMGLIEAGSYSAGQYSFFDYPTQKESRIYEFKPVIGGEESESGFGLGNIEPSISIRNRGGNIENGANLTLPKPGYYEPYQKIFTVCIEQIACNPLSVTESHENLAELRALALESGAKKFEYSLVPNTVVMILQEKGPSVSVDTTDSSFGSAPNGASTWVNASAGKIGLVANDPGIGINKDSFSSPQATGWGQTFTAVAGCEGVQCNECWNWTSKCEAGHSASGEPLTYSLNGLPAGKDTVEAKVEDAAALTATVTGTVNIDNTPPHNITLTGLPSGNMIVQGEGGEYHLKAEATDGSGTTPSSGVKSIALSVDGREVGKASGSCSPGPCTAMAEWTINGEEFGVGSHTFKVTATDNAGNFSSESYTVTVHLASPVSLGPGSVNPITGEFALGGNDVSFGGLSVGRAYGSRRLSAGVEGPLGPQWRIGMGAMTSLEVLPDASVTSNGPDGLTHFSVKSGGGFESPPGDSNVSLSAVMEGSSVKEYLLKNAARGATTRFTLPSGAKAWMPTVSEGVVATDTITGAYQTVEPEAGKKVVEPVSELAPVPAGVSCSPTLNKGCRALTFNYATSTTASGEAPSEWGDYVGRLTRVYFTAWDPSKGAMVTTAVVQYAYDTRGWLRAEWDPRISPALKSTYGYDAEGHVTALSPPGQQPWLLHYGTGVGDLNTGRLLSVTRPSASTALGNGLVPQNTVLPTLSSGTPAVGAKISVSANGTWSNTPLAYSYQWQDCNSSGLECAAITGAVNQSYYPVASDEHHTLVAQVTAINAGGSTVASTAASGLVGAGTPYSPAPEPPNSGTSAVTTIDYHVPVSGAGAPYALGAKEVEEGWAQKDLPTEATAVFPPDEPQGWPAGDYKRATVYYLDGGGRAVNVASPGGAIATSEYNVTNDVVRSLSADNRAAALKEGAKSAEVAKLLDTQSTYNAGGTELLNTLGPEHKVKLSGGSEVQARKNVVYRYDEGAPSEGGPYRLVTKTTEGAKYSGGEADVRTTVTSYSGQEGLGWKLRKPTSVTTDPSGLNLVRTTIYDPLTGNVVETRQPSTEVVAQYSGQFGSSGTGNGQFKYPYGVAVDSAGHVWVADTINNRVQEFSSEGAYMRQFGSSGTGNGKFGFPEGVAVDSAGHVWVADTINNRVQEFSSEGAYIRQFGSSGTGNGQFSKPYGVAVDSAGHVWVTDGGNNRVQEFSSEGAYIRQFGSLGTGNGQFNNPYGVAVDSAGHVWVTDMENNRVQEFSSEGAYIRQFGSSGTGNGQFQHPAGVAVDSAGHVWVTDSNNNRVQEWTSAPALPVYTSQFGSSGTGNGQFKYPYGVAVDSAGHVWVTDGGNNRVQEFSSEGAYIRQFGSLGTGNGQFKFPYGVAVDSTGHVWVADRNNNRVQEFSSEGAYIRQFGSSGTGNGQFKSPVGVAVDSAGHVWVTDVENNRVQEFSSEGAYIRQFGSSGTGNGQFKYPHGVAVDSAGHVWVTDDGNNRVQEFSSEGTYIRKFGSFGTGNGQFKSGLYGMWLTLDTSGHVWVTDGSNSRVQEFSSEGAYMRQFGSSGTGNGQFKSPVGVAVDSAGHVWVTDVENNRVQEFTLTLGASEDSQVSYYMAGADAAIPACGNHPEWANLPCRTQPAAQPETAGLPNLPVTTVASYNMYDEPLTSTSTVGTDTRTSTATYDEAGRVTSSAISSTVGNALPAVNDKYSTTSGALIEQSTTVEGKTQSITDTFNALGQLTGYTDADGNTSTFEYEGEKDGRLVHLDDGKGTQTYSYDPTTGAPTGLVDSAAGTFTASYDVEGNMTSEGYPNAMSANYTLNPAGQVTSLQYIKTASCATSCPETWYSDSVVPSIHGQWLSQSSSLASQAYSYDQAGRLTQVQNTPTGKGCITRMYAYDAETNRLSLTTREPAVEGKCALEGGTVESHAYDPANRLLDAGTAYDSFGNTAKLPASDAGGSELTSAFYQDNQLQSQTQAGQTIGYQLDPAGRTREVVSTGKVVAAEIQHYAGPGSTPAWTGELSGNWTRNIQGMSGLGAIQHDGETPVLQLANLHGDIIATASDSETATALASTIGEAGEYGAPATEAPPKYSWLGAHELRTELPSGVVAMGARSYVPQLGRFLQSDPIPGGSANAYAYTYGDPVNSFDLTGMYSATVSGALIEANDREGAEVAARVAAEEAARAEAERKAAEAAAQAAAYAAMTASSPYGESYAEEGPEEEWGEEGEDEWEYASLHDGKGAQSNDHVEEGILFQSQEGEENSGDGGASWGTYEDVRRNGRAFGPYPHPSRRITIHVPRPCYRYENHGETSWKYKPPASRSDNNPWTNQNAAVGEYAGGGGSSFPEIP